MSCWPIWFLYWGWPPLSGGVSWLVGFANEGTTFVFGGLFNNDQIGFVFALGVLPVIIFIGALIGLLYYLRVIQWFIEIVGTYQPRLEPSGVVIDNEKALKWLRNGAKPTDTVERLLKISGAWDEFKGGAPAPVAAGAES